MLGGSPPWASTEALEHRSFLPSVNAYGSAPCGYPGTRLHSLCHSPAESAGGTRKVPEELLYWFCTLIWFGTETSRLWYYHSFGPGFQDGWPNTYYNRRV